jgi:2-oxoglutarate ferredoxin oxidoreductase subunit beta
LRRNLDIKILLFNNKIYGLTKGQYSPTTPKGSITKSSPDGTIEDPFLPGELAMGAQGNFFARVVDTDLEMMREVFTQAARHKGTALIEVLQNCVIFNDDIHAEITSKELRDEHQIYLKHGQPMLFGKKMEFGLVQEGTRFKVVKVGENGVGLKDILVHNALDHDDTKSYMLVRMSLPNFPIAMGVIRSCGTEVYEDLLYRQMDSNKAKSKIKTVDDLLTSGNTFSI